MLSATKSWMAQPFAEMNTRARFEMTMTRMIAKPMMPGPFIRPMALKTVMMIMRTGIMVSIRYLPTKVLRRRETAPKGDPSFLVTQRPKAYLPRVRPCLRKSGTMNSRAMKARNSERAAIRKMSFTMELRASRISVSSFMAATAAS